MPNASPRVCVVGSSNIDLFFRTVRLPQPGETLAGQAFQMGYGGKGANQAVMAARLGAQVHLIGRVGRDVFGEDTLRNYRAQGVDATFVGIDEARGTGVAAIVVDEAARNCIIVVPGANAGLSPQDVRAAASAIEMADVLLCQLEVPLESVREALRLARAAGVRTILNPAPAWPLPDEVLQLADLCVPNETEAELLTGQPVTTRAQAESAARSLLQRGPRTVIITRGEHGVLVVDAAAVTSIPAFPVEAVDTTGAGDAFIGSLGVFLAEGKPLLEAVRQANAAAALSVTRPGTQAALPTRAEVEALQRGPGSSA